MSVLAHTGPLLRLHPEDPVAVARRDLAPGEHLTAGGTALSIREPVPRGHKVALTPLAAAQPVHKYGQVIGITTQAIAAGQHVHDHNLISPSRRATLTPAPASRYGAAPPPTPVDAPASFAGYRRADGRVGTRNYVAVLSTVNCSATVVRRIAAAFSVPGALDEHPGVDGVMAVTHGTGCGMSADGEGLAVLRRTLRGYASHPNVGGVVVVGLGCEVNQVAGLASELDLAPGIPIVHMTIQGVGGTAATIRAGVQAVRELLPIAGAARRSPVPLSELVLGLNCGGSDAWSGVSANPVLGVAVDGLVAAGGTAILAETPEIHGAEHLLTSRAVSAEVAAALMERVAWWERYAAADGGNLDNNPSPGNRAGGVTTIEEKSLGAVAKGGSSLLRAVYRYAEPVTERGLVFMDTPGYDPVSVTGIVAGGANLVCFTTGRGSVFGAKPAPSLKLATTAELYRRMADDMDLDCGPVLDGSASVQELGAALLQQIAAVASGRPTKSEELDLGDEEFTPWQLGSVM
ncbi:MAG TPA: altronate dehydratase family protein [Solirubrobacteraceae bacterium]|nr:altronate dehydratase family protein [Solirubrobacteraceae bacterium]